METHELDGVSVRIYNPEKTLADCFKFRNKIGLDTAVEAVRFYRERRSIKVDDLMRYAVICRVKKIIRPLHRGNSIMAKNIKNTAASVHQRLLNKAKEASRPFNELLQHFAIERFIYRLSKNPHADRFILKGALMLSTWRGAASRPTMDIDLLRKIDNRLEVIVAAMKDACGMDVETDGMSFNAETVTAAGITEDAEYEGVRVRVQEGPRQRASLPADRYRLRGCDRSGFQ